MRIVLLAIIAVGAVALFMTTRDRAPDAPPNPVASATDDSPSSTTTPTVAVEARPMLATAPEVLRSIHQPLVDIDGWLQSDVESLEELRGQVVVVEFWTFGCRNCKNRIPHTQDLYARYQDEGLEIVGIHSPEFAYEEEVDRIVAAAGDLGVTWPIVLDTNKLTFRNWQGLVGTAYWPRTYVLDQIGQVRYDHIGEGGYEELEATVAYLLANPAS